MTKKESDFNTDEDLSLLTSMTIKKSTHMELAKFSDYVNAYSQRAHSRSEIILLLIKCVDYRKLNKLLDKATKIYKI